MDVKSGCCRQGGKAFPCGRDLGSADPFQRGDAPQRPEMTLRRDQLPASFDPARGPEEIAQAPPAERAGGDHTVVDDDTPAPPPRCAADELPPPGDSLEQRLGARTAGIVELGRIGVRQADLDPALRIRRSADAQAVAVPHVADRPRECPARNRG